MLNLDASDHQQLVNLLKDLPEMATEASRRMILEYAGLKKLLPMIDLSGAPFIAANQIVSNLSKYGRLTYNHEALGLLLNSVKILVGLQEKEILDRLLIKYNMMEPIAPSHDIGKWQGRETGDKVFEKIIGENTLRPIAFLSQGLKVARSVVYIGVRTNTKRWSGTGFMISPDLILTNHHVVPNPDLLNSALFRFKYEENFKGEARKPIEYQAKADGIFHTNETLDYSIIQLEREPGNEWGWIPLLCVNIRKDDRVNIIQHPNGRPKHISLQNNFVEYADDNVVQYVTSTQPGSSGSPVFNDEWALVAIHHAGGNIREPRTQRRYFRNEGILISNIINSLPSELRKLINMPQSIV